MSSWCRQVVSWQTLFDAGVEKVFHVIRLRQLRVVCGMDTKKPASLPAFLLSFSRQNPGVQVTPESVEI
jgi:hypothetical protein